MKVGRVYRVDWEDSAMPPDSAWLSEEETIETVTCKTVGFLTHQTKRRIVMSSSVGGTQHCGILAIPRSAIRKVKRLR